MEFVSVFSAADMAEAVLSRSDDMDAVIMAAAVADYTPAEKAENKIKKSEGEFAIAMKRTTDILQNLGDRKKDGQVLIGFAMETENLLSNAAGKLEKKNADYIIANSINEEGAGFQVDTNSVTIISRDHQERLGLLSKEETAEKILAYCLGKE